MPPYSSCSPTVQSRRRADLVFHICALAGVSEDAEDKSECVQLLRDVLAQAPLRSVGEQVAEGAALRTVMGNIKRMHDAVPPERRTQVLALAAPAFTSPELRTRWQLNFGTHQFQEARQLARAGRFAVEPRARHMPESRRPKSDEFVARLHAFLDARSRVDAQGRRIAGQSMRSLHRAFVDMDAGRNKVSYSAFRRLALAHVRLPSAEALQPRELPPQGLPPLGPQPLELQPLDPQPPDFGALGLASQLSLPLPQLPLSQLLLEPMSFDNLLLASQPSASQSTAPVYDIPTIQSLIDLASSGAGAEPTPPQSLPLPLPLPQLLPAASDDASDPNSPTHKFLNL
ncbi:hypothetical protein IWW55_004899 [Coemansia sp. RSA 2706]|nr:hypothetical protein IWW55_004899 [Coemansia sp. RSA 2706]KAJ2318845.1 hypothetical protein IWW51_005015 [Coemansia sp. RSA 2702]